MTDIKLNFINKSNDINNSEVVIFQKNVATSFSEIAIAWTVIQNCGRGDNHPFVYPMKSEVNAADSYGNYTPHLNAPKGQSFHVIKTNTGDELQPAGPATNPDEIEIKNNLNSGSINANVYKDGKLLATKTSISPAQKAVFNFKPTLFIGVVSQLVEGEVMNSAITSDINTELSLLGLASADIVMTGGGVGPSATPFTFMLENILYA